VNGSAPRGTFHLSALLNGYALAEDHLRRHGWRERVAVARRGVSAWQWQSAVAAALNGLPRRRAAAQQIVDRLDEAIVVNGVGNRTAYVACRAGEDIRRGIGGLNHQSARVDRLEFQPLSASRLLAGQKTNHNRESYSDISHLKSPYGSDKLVPPASPRVCGYTRLIQGVKRNT
jgi:hypothetical protein